MNDPVARAVVYGAVAAIAALFAALSLMPKPGAKPQIGWRRLRPSRMHLTGVLLGGGLIGLFAYVRLFVGSRRLDAESQMAILFWLILAFTFGVLAVGCSMARIYRQGARWSGQTISFFDGKKQASYEFADVATMRQTPVGSVVIEVRDGAKLPLDPYATTAEDLIGKLGDHLKARTPES